MKKIFLVLLIILGLQAKDTVVIGHTMYQKQKYDYKNTIIFETDKEGLRVWNWQNGQKYCKRLKLGGFKDWRVASKKELLALMSKAPIYNTLYVKRPLAMFMPEPDVKYHDVWFWSRDSKKPNLGAFVNFKKANSGWADKKYKGYILCTRDNKPLKSANCKGMARQELSHSKNWLEAWSTCKGYVALKKDGSLWQFGKVGGCNYGQIYPLGEYKKEYIYHLKPKLIGRGFRGAKFYNSGYRVYAIKKDGSLWGWGENLSKKPKKLSHGKWASFGIKYIGNGCCGYDVGLKKDGTLWRFSENMKVGSKLYKISKFNDWKKIVLGCCNIYGLRKNSTLWRFSQTKSEEVNFKRYKPKKEYNGDMELLPLLKSKMAKLKSGIIYSSDAKIATLKPNRDGTLCIEPKVNYINK